MRFASSELLKIEQQIGPKAKGKRSDAALAFDFLV
jgi:hypothetical protein